MLTRAPRRRFRVVLGELQPSPFADEEGIEPRHWTWIAEPRVVADQRAFPIGELELREEILVLDRGAIRRMERAQYHCRPLLQKSVLRRREKTRAQNRAERAIPEEQPAKPKLLVEALLRFCR